MELQYIGNKAITGVERMQLGEPITGIYIGDPWFDHYDGDRAIESLFPTADAHPRIEISEMTLIGIHADVAGRVFDDLWDELHRIEANRIAE